MKQGRHNTAGWGFGLPVFVATATLSCASAAPLGSGVDTAAQSIGEYDLARDAFGRNSLREALEHTKKALALDDQNADAAYLGSLIMLAFCAGADDPKNSSDCRFGEAESYARAALKIKPDMRDAKNTLGVILVHQDRYDEAISVLKPLADDMVYATPEKAWGNLGWAYLLRGNNDEAIDALTRAIAVQPLFCVGYYRLGLAYEKKGELKLAREALSKALSTERPECRTLQDAFDARARIAVNQGLRDEAKADYETCRDIARTTTVGQRCAAELKRMESP